MARERSESRNPLTPRPELCSKMPFWRSRSARAQRTGNRRRARMSPLPSLTFLNHLCHHFAGAVAENFPKPRTHPQPYHSEQQCCFMLCLKSYVMLCFMFGNVPMFGSTITFLCMFGGCYVWTGFYPFFGRLCTFKASSRAAHHVSGFSSPRLGQKRHFRVPEIFFWWSTPGCQTEI